RPVHQTHGRHCRAETRIHSGKRSLRRQSRYLRQLSPRQYDHFWLRRKLCAAEHDHGRLVELDRINVANAIDEALQRARSENVHGDYDAWLDLRDHFDHAVDTERVAAVDRHQHYIDTHELIEMLLCQRMVQMFKMCDANPRDLEYENRIGRKN